MSKTLNYCDECGRLVDTDELMRMKDPIMINERNLCRKCYEAIHGPIVEYENLKEKTIKHEHNKEIFEELDKMFMDMGSVYAITKANYKDIRKKFLEE